MKSFTLALVAFFRVWASLSEVLWPMKGKLNLYLNYPPFP